MAITSQAELEVALSQHPQSAEILEYVASAVEAEKQTGITLKRKANAEAHGLRKWKQAVESVGFEADDPEGLQAWIEEKIKKAPPPDPNAPNPEVEKLRKEFAKATKALEDEKANAAKIKLTADRRAIKAKLVEALREKVYGHDILAENLINSNAVKLAEDESVVFVNGDDEMEFTAGVKKLLESRPDLLKNNQVPGAQSKTKPNGGAAQRYTIEQIKTMTPEQIAADMDNVKASMALLRA